MEKKYFQSSTLYFDPDPEMVCVRIQVPYRQPAEPELPPGLREVRG